MALGLLLLCEVPQMTDKKEHRFPTSIDELVKFIATSVQNHFEKSGQRMDGSLLAYTIRTEYPAIDYTKLGLTRFGDAVRMAEKMALIRRHHDVKHLELSPPDAEPNQEASAKSPETAERRYVRNDVWRAFVFHSHTPIFLDREALTLCQASDEKAKAITTMSASPRYCEIEQISRDVQTEWAKQFLSSTSDSEQFSEEDAKALLHTKPNRFSISTVRSWKSFLSSKVINHICVWAADNNIPTDEILIPTKKRNELERFSAQPAAEAAIRKAIIATIQDMPLADLDRLALPIKYVRRHFTAK